MSGPGTGPAGDAGTLEALVLEALVLEALREVIPGCPELTPATELLASGLLDSFGVVAVAGLLEDRCGLEFPPELLTPETFADPGSLAAALAAVRSAGTG